MQNIEHAIRQELLKTDASNAETRKQVYEAAWSAQERFFLSMATADDTEKDNKRDQLQQLIAKIENEFRQQPEKNIAVQPSSDVVLKPKNDDAQATTNQDNQASQRHASGYLDTKELAPQHRHNKIVDNWDEQQDHQPGKPSKKKGFRPFLYAFILIFIAVAGFIIWAFYNSIIGFTGDIKSNDFANHPPLTVDQNPVYDNTAAANGWIKAFNPQSTVSLGVRGQTKTQMHRDGDENYMRVQSKNADDAVVINIGKSILNSLRGKKVTFNVIVRSSHDTASPVGITCDFAAGQGCGRKRFDAPAGLARFLFNADIPAAPTKDGKLYITSDLLGGGHSVDILSIFVKPIE